MMRAKTMLLPGLVATAVLGVSLVALRRFPGEHVARQDVPKPLETMTTTPVADSEGLRHVQQQLEKLSRDLAEVRQLAQVAALPHVRRLETQMSQVQTQLDRLSAAQDAVPPGNDSGKAPVHAAESVPPVSPEVLQARERQQTQRIIAALDTHLRGETYDTQWAPQTEQEIAEVFAGAAPAVESTLQHLACQATLCRLEVSHTDNEAERAFMMRLGQLEAFTDAEAFYERIEHEDGSIATVVYAARQGHRLPQLANALQ
jgi:hypothetical protein